MAALRVGVIGLGIGRRHIQAYQALPGVEVAALADVDEAARKQAQADFGVAQGFADYRELLGRPEIDAVSICTPDRLHAEQAIAAVDAGKHVLCEKPLATTVEDAARIVQRVRKAPGLTFMTGHNFRFQPQFARLKEMAEQGVVGPLYYGESSYIQDLYSMEKLGPNYWRLKDPQDFVIGGAIHNVDLVRWLVGEVEEVQAFSRHVMPFYPLDDNYCINLRFAGGAIGRLLLLLGSRLKNQFVVDVAVYGPDGALKAVLQKDEVIHDGPAAQGDGPAVIPTPAGSSHAIGVAHFVECIRSGRRPLIDVVEGAKGIAVCEAAVRSARERRPIAVDYSTFAE